MSRGARWTGEQYQAYLKGMAAGMLDEIQKDRKERAQVGRQREKSPEARHDRLLWKKRKQELKEEGIDADEVFYVSFLKRKQNRKV